MHPITYIQEMISETKIFVPDYQRAYSWESPSEDSDRKTHTDVFLSDLNSHKDSNSGSKYYFGHFIFESKDDRFYIIDGQQRLTTIIIFLSSLFLKLRNRNLSAREQVSYENLIAIYSTSWFSTVDYDNQFFLDYVINQTTSDDSGLDTISKQRIANAFNYFNKELANKDDKYLVEIFEIICKAVCTTLVVNNESESIQMFIFQNNRGKKPSNLEIIKAQFMYSINLGGGNLKDSLLRDIKSRFQNIYKCISAIEYKIDEDDVLIYTLRVHFNSLKESSPLARIDSELKKDDSIEFIRKFSNALSVSFDKLKLFFGNDEKSSHNIHSLISLGGIAVAIPFVIKAYSFNLDIKTIESLCCSLESIILRDRVISTRADITSRLDDVFSKFTIQNPTIQLIVDRVEMLKTTSESWWAYWSTDEFNRALQGDLNHHLARFLLWKYENYLQSPGKASYQPIRYDMIISPELEHVAPTTEPTKPSELPHGYGPYDADFVGNYINCIGNFLLLGKSHNCAIGNVKFATKRATYTRLQHHKEIFDQAFVPLNGEWNKHAIQQRKSKIVGFITQTF